MTNTTEDQPTLDLKRAARLELANAVKVYDAYREDVTATVKAGDFEFAAASQMGHGVRLQFRVRVLSKIVERGDSAVVAQLAPALSDRARSSCPFDRAVIAARRDEALSVLRLLLPWVQPGTAAELVAYMV